MDLLTLLHHDHENLRSLGEDILKSTDEATGGLRDDQFELYDTQLRRHLAVMEEVILTPLKGDPAAGEDAGAMPAEHKAIRAELKSLDRSPKNTREWSDEFARLAGRFQSLAARHHALASRAGSLGTPDELGRRYEQAKLRQLEGPVARAVPGGATTLTTLAGAAALAGAAYAATRFLQSRREDRPQDGARSREGRRPLFGRRRDADRDFALKLETDENLRLIASDKVEGTAVVDRDGANIGSIQNFMVDKYTGRVAYAVLSFGGTFGFGASLFPLPWSVLTYDEGAGGYRLDVGKEELNDAPRFEKNDAPEFSPEYRRTLLIFYRSRGADDGGAARLGGASAGGYDANRSPDASGGRSAFGFGQGRADASTGADATPGAAANDVASS